MYFKSFLSTKQQNYRKIKHIWLLHLNVINAYAINDLLKMANEFNYKFVSLDEVLKTRSKNRKRREIEKPHYPLANQEQKDDIIQ